MNKDLKICTDCQFILNNKKENSRCPVCDSPNLVDFDKYQEPLCAIDKIKNFLDTLDPNDKQRIISLFNLAQRMEPTELQQLILKLNPEEGQLILKLRNEVSDGESSESDRKLYLRLHEVDESLTESIYSDVFINVISDAINKKDAASITLLEKVYEQKFELFCEKIKNKDYTKTTEFTLALRKLLKHLKIPQKKSSHIGKKAVYMGGVEQPKFKPYFTTDEFDATFGSNRGMENVPDAGGDPAPGGE